MKIRSARTTDSDAMWQAFRHRDLGLVDAYLMYRFLDDIELESEGVIGVQRR